MQLSPPLPEIALLGRSNVGKSSLLNAMVGRRIARVSGTPGKTRALNAFEIDGAYYLLDLPGYGYARASKDERAGFRTLLEATLARSTLSAVVWLLDIRHDLSTDDHAIRDVLSGTGVRTLAALTKGDKLPRGAGRKREAELAAELELDDDQILLTSAKTGTGIADLREALAALIRKGGGMNKTVFLLGLWGAIAAPPARRARAQDTLPVGFGTLKRDDIAINFSTGQLQIQVLPLDESVTRLLAPDTYTSLTQLIKQRQADIDDQAQRSAVRNPTLVMVTFFGMVSQARFVPEDINLTSRGRLFRPVGIVPLSPQWSGQQLDARQQATAIYLFDAGIAWGESLTASYEGMNNDSWSKAIQKLNTERVRVMSRASARAPAH